MDPFSLAAGVAGLVTLVVKITKLVTNYFHGVRRAIEAANELLDELKALRLTLTHLEILLRNDKKDAFSSTSILVKSTDACSNKLTMLHTKLQDTVRQPLQKLRWPLNASFHHEILQHIRNYTQSIHFALTLDGSVLLSKTFEEVVEVLSNQVGVVEHLKQLQSGANYTHTIAEDTRQIVQNLDAAQSSTKPKISALHIKTVLIEPTEGQMADALDRLPLSLDAAFGETLRRIKAQGDSTPELALNCLMWISHAKRPLTVEDLSDALAITKTYTCSIPFNVKYRPLQKQITDSCHGLITVEQKSKIARLAHYSIHEYLRGSQVQTFTDGEKIIAEVCIAYQMLEPFESECLWEESEISKMLDDCPFYAYAARNWGHHVRVADDTGVNQIALNFLRADSQRARSYQVFQFSHGRRAEYWEPDEATSCNGLHLATTFGLTDIVRKFLPDYAIDTPTAASSGFSDLVTLFLSMNADPNWNNWYGTALHCAAEADQTATIETLLDAGVDVNLQDEHNRVPLLCAMQSGHTAAMRTLLDRGADVNFYDGTCTVLFDAVEMEDPEVVQLLLDYRADPNIISVDTCVPLYVAAVKSDSSIAQMLLNHGTKVDTPDVYGRAALHIAAMLGQDQLIRLFLDRGATIDAQSRDGSTALHLAAEQGRGKSVRLLLEEGAKLELTNDGGYTPLQVAAINNETEVLQLLIEAGDECERKYHWNGDPLACS
ncbi:MAG: hypothetical protein Q9188_007322 [Gyalolechia gomerana]